MDEFRANNYFPPKADPLLETFGLLAEILVVLTELSSIIHGRSRDRCQVEMDQLKDAMDAFVKKEGWFSEYSDRQLRVLQLWHPRCTFDKSPFYEAAFKVLSAHGHGWAYVDEDLFVIASIQEEHISRTLGLSKPTSADTPEEMENSISKILASYGAGHVDPLDFPAIFEAVSDHRVPDVVWAFQRVYGELPVGYPMNLADYMF